MQLHAISSQNARQHWYAKERSTEDVLLTRKSSESGWRRTQEKRVEPHRFGGSTQDKTEAAGSHCNKDRDRFRVVYAPELVVSRPCLSQDGERGLTTKPDLQTFASDRTCRRKSSSRKKASAFQIARGKNSEFRKKSARHAV